MGRSENPKDLIREFKQKVKKADANRKEIITTTLIVKPEFSPAWAQNDDQPYRVFDKNFSRLAVSILWKSTIGGKTSGKLSVDANISVDRLAGIYVKAQQAGMIDTYLGTYAYKGIVSSLQKATDLLQNNRGASVVSGGGADANKALAMERAKEITIANGRLKGLTPYQAAIEGKTEMLKNQIDWLNSKSNENPNYRANNDKQVNAIRAALWLADNGLLNDNGAEAAGSGAGSASADVIVLLSAEPKGQERKADPETGLSRCHEISILWHIGDRYPVEVTVVNYDAPVRRDDCNRPNVIKSERRTKEDGRFDDKIISFRLDEHSFWDCVRLVKMHMERFGYLYAVNQFTDADDCENANRQAAGYAARSITHD